MELETQQVSAALIAVIVPLILGWLLRSANSATKKVGGVSWLTYSNEMKLLSVVLSLIVPALIILWFNVDAKDKEPVAWMIALFGGLTLPLFLELFFVRIGYDSKKIYCKSIWRPNRDVAWPDVQSVTFSQSMSWWVLETNHSGKIRVSQFMSGVPELLKELEKRGIKSSEER